MDEEEAYDERLRERLVPLREQFAAGKIRVAEHLAEDTFKSLNAVRVGSDGRVDLSTVDGRVRSMALAISAFENRKNAMKQVSLRQVQEEYFRAVEATFGDVYKLMKDFELTPEQMAEGMHRDTEQVAQIRPIIKDFVSILLEFWEGVGETVSYYLEDMSCIKGVFGGDLFPLSGRNIASTCGLYIDTIVLTDPFMNSNKMFELWDDKTAVRFFVKHGLNVLTYKDLALADLVNPIVVILPFSSSLEESDRELVTQVAEPDALKHAQRIFGQKFDEIDELLEFCQEMDTPTEVIKRVVERERVLFDTEWTEPFEEQIGKSWNELGKIHEFNSAGMAIFMQCTGRMMQATDLIMKSQRLGGTPLIEAETSWQFFNWKLEYSAAMDLNSVPLHMMHGLQHAGNSDVQWLGKIPPADLIEMRKTGALHEIRNILSHGVGDIAAAKPLNFFRTSDHIVKNIEDAFEQHRINISELSAKRWKFVTGDIGSWIVTGSIGLAAAITSNPALAVGAFAADQILPSSKLRDLPGRAKGLLAGGRELMKSPMGLLFKHAS